MNVKVAALSICLVMVAYGITAGNLIQKTDEVTLSELDRDEDQNPVQWVVKGYDHIEEKGKVYQNDMEKNHPNDSKEPILSIPEEGDKVYKSSKKISNRYTMDPNSQTFTIPLNKGWNMVSIPLIQEDTSIRNVLKSIEGSYDTVYSYDASDPTNLWKQYHVNKPEEMNDLSEINHKMGFSIHMIVLDILIVKGELPDYTDIPLYNGWNFVGYPSLTVRSPNMASLPSSVHIIEHYNVTSKIWKYWNLSNPAMNTLDMLRPGEGYWLYLKEDANWVTSKDTGSTEEPGFEFPEDLSTVCAFDDLNAFFDLNETQEALLRANGFVGITGFGSFDDFSEAYIALYDSFLPIFITTDSILHTYHIFFDDLLRSIEEDYLIGHSENMTIAMLKKSTQQYENITLDLNDRALNNVAYFSVAMKLIDPNASIPTYVEDVVCEELALIENHTGFSGSPIFGYKEDYSQYKPRGHYTRSDALKRYFKEMMWYGRIMFRVKSDNETVQAIMISDGMQTASHNGMASDYWDTIYEITSYFVGEADDLTYKEYLVAINDVYGSLSSDYNELLDTNTLEAFKEDIKSMRKPSICSSFVTDQQNMTEETLGLRFMGQRFIPDSYMFQQLVYDKVGTTVCPRLFPKGLDIMAVLGSKKAENILDEEGETSYEYYPEQLGKLKGEFSNIPAENWSQNMYWSWLYSLKSLTINFSEENYPQFMKNTAWQDEKLNTNLGSWAELRHDTILYAKQSYTIIVTSVPPPPPPHYEKGYVEPVPDFYQRMMDLTNTTIDGLNAFGVLSTERNNNLIALRDLIASLKTISEKELNDQELTPIEYDLIKNIGERLENIVGDVDPEGLKTTMVADVHTDPNSKQCLEEAVGYIDFVVILVEMPNGSFASMAGPIFSYYEFKQPMSDRLTDEQWEEWLENGNQPPRPEWVRSFLT